jgi:hypothetical protein
MLPSMVPSVGTAFRAGQAWIAVPPAIKAAGLTYLPPRNPAVLGEIWHEIIQK